MAAHSQSSLSSLCRSYHRVALEGTITSLSSLPRMIQLHLSSHLTQIPAFTSYLIALPRDHCKSSFIKSITTSWEIIINHQKSGLKYAFTLDDPWWWVTAGECTRDLRSWPQSGPSEQCSRNYCLLSGCSAYSAVRGIWIEFLPAFLDWLRITLLNVKTKLNRSYDILHSSHLTHSEHLQFVWRGYINWPDLQTYSRQPQVFVCAIL